MTPLKYDPESEERIVTRLKRLRAERDDGAVRDRIDALRAATEAGKNVIPYILEAVKVYATVGEIGAVFRDVHGAYSEDKIYL